MEQSQPRHIDPLTFRGRGICLVCRRRVLGWNRGCQTIWCPVSSLSAASASVIVQGWCSTCNCYNDVNHFVVFRQHPNPLEPDDDGHDVIIHPPTPVERIPEEFDEFADREPLGLPESCAEFCSRFETYDEWKEHAKKVFAVDLLEGFRLARVAYYRSYSLLAFLHLHSLKELEQINPEYSDDHHESDLRKLVIILRKLGEACFYLNRLDEGLLNCTLAIKVAGERLKSITWVAQAVMTKIWTEKGDFVRARLALQQATVIWSRIRTDDSRILTRAKENLDIASGQAVDGQVDDGPSMPGGPLCEKPLIHCTIESLTKSRYLLNSDFAVPEGYREARQAILDSFLMFEFAEVLTERISYLLESVLGSYGGTLTQIVLEEVGSSPSSPLLLWNWLKIK